MNQDFTKHEAVLGRFSFDCVEEGIEWSLDWSGERRKNIDGLRWLQEMMAFDEEKRNKKKEVGSEESKSKMVTEEGGKVDIFLLVCKVLETTCFFFFLLLTLIEEGCEAMGVSAVASA